MAVEPSMPKTFVSNSIQNRCVSCFSSPRPFQSAANRAAAVRLSTSVIVYLPQKGYSSKKYNIFCEKMVEFFSYFYRYSYCACINTTKILGIHRRGTVLRFRNNRTVTRFTFSGQGIQTAIWRSGTQSPENGGGIQGGILPLLAHDFRRKSSVLYLLSRLARERDGAVWRRRFPAPGNQTAEWSVSNHSAA